MPTLSFLPWTFIPLIMPMIMIYLFATHIPDPYMDEEFHIRQTQHYCTNHWRTYDPKLTTPPGLYVVSLSILYMLKPVILGINGNPFMDQAALIIPRFMCTVTLLRLTNTLVSWILFLLIYKIFQFHFSGGRTQSNSSSYYFWNAVNAYIHPIASFYYPLYYTDTCSTCTVLATYYFFCVQPKYKLAAMLGIFSILVRQTNLVWMAFSMGAALLNRIQDVSNTVIDPCPLNGGYHSFFGLVGQFIQLVLVQHSSLTLTIIGPSFVLLFSLYMSMVFFDIPLVLGDRLNHQFAFHVPQILYCLTVCFALCVPIVFRPSHLRPLLNSFSTRSFRRLVLVALTIAGVGWVIQQTTYEHPFLLSDNRHLTFYLWNRGFRQYWWFKYALIPVYYVCGSLLYRRIAQARGQLSILLLLCATSLSLIPSPLMEIRYYIIPSLMYRMHCLETSASWLALETFGLVCVSICLNYVFLFWTFMWYSEPNKLMRFML